MMEYDIFFKCIAFWVNKIYTSIHIIRVHLTTTFIYRHKRRFNTRSCLSHNTCCTCRCNCQTCNITTTIFHHLFIQCSIFRFNTCYKWIILLTFSIIHFKRTTFFCHLHTRTICFNCYHAMHFFRKFSSFFCSITQSQRGQHISFCSNTHTRTTTSQCFIHNLIPQLILSAFHDIILWV